MRLATELDAIAEYTRAHPELQKAHHFLFDLPITDASRKSDIVVVGINPGEREQNDIDTFPLEESSRYDFHQHIGEDAGAIRWRRQVARFCGPANVTQTEFFFWSSRNATNAFEERFGYPLQYAGAHLRFCASLNGKLFEYHDPKVIVAPGLSSASLGVAYYDLRFRGRLRDEAGHRIVEKFECPSGRIWLFTKHWSGSRGFNQAQRDLVKRAIASELT